MPHAWSLCAAQGTLHVFWAVHVLGLADTNVVLDGVTCLAPFIAPWGEKGGPKDALWTGLALLFEPFAARLFKTHVPSERQRVPCPEGCIGKSGCFSYIGASVHAGGEQLYLHLDKGNIEFTLVLVFGAPMEGWPQLFPTVGCVVLASGPQQQGGYTRNNVRPSRLDLKASLPVQSLFLQNTQQPQSFGEAAGREPLDPCRCGVKLP